MLIKLRIKRAQKKMEARLASLQVERERERRMHARACREEDEGDAKA